MECKHTTWTVIVAMIGWIPSNSMRPIQIQLQLCIHALERTDFLLSSAYCQAWVYSPYYPHSISESCAETPFSAGRGSQCSILSLMVGTTISKGWDPLFISHFPRHGVDISKLRGGIVTSLGHLLRRAPLHPLLGHGSALVLSVIVTFVIKCLFCH